MVDPKLEIAAAAMVLRSDGVLLIEVPILRTACPGSDDGGCLGFNPNICTFCRRRYWNRCWMPKISVEQWEFGAAHTANEFSLSFDGMVCFGP